MSVKVTDDDLGWDRILRSLDGFKGEVTTGIQAKEGKVPSNERREDGTVVDGWDDGPTVVEKAAANEFGTARAPERSFLRSTFDENRRKYAVALHKGLTKVIDGEEDFERVFLQLGEVVVGDVQEKITSLRDPPNADETIDFKGSDNPLIDSGQMRQSIRSKVTINQKAKQRRTLKR